MTGAASIERSRKRLAAAALPLLAPLVSVGCASLIGAAFDDARPIVDASSADVAVAELGTEASAAARDDAALSDSAPDDVVNVETGEPIDTPDADAEAETCSRTCDGICARDDDPATGCGRACKPCPAVPGAVAICEAAGCGHACLFDHVPCANGCCPRVTTPSFDTGGAFTCALDGEGVARCWGENVDFQVSAGVGGGVVPGEIRIVAGLPRAKKIVAGGDHACVLSTDGEVHCWGRARETTDLVWTVRKIAVPPAVDLFAGSGTTCALSAMGDLTCWGLLDDHELEPPRPVDRDVRAAFLGLHYRCVIGARRGDLRCSGHDALGRVGLPPLGVTVTSNTPRGFERDVDAVSTGMFAGCASRSGVTACWGWDLAGQLGRPPAGTDAGTVWPEPRPIDGPSDFVALDAMANYACGLTRDARVVCWGYRESPSEVRHLPKTIEGLDGVRAVSVGGHHVCARRDDGLWCFGSNVRGQLGIVGQSSEIPRRVEVP
jgi:hypothetical protein